MIRINDSEQLKGYIDTYKLQDYLETNLFSIAELFFFEKNEHLIHTGEISNYFYFLVEGTVMVYSHTSEEQNLCINYSYQSTLIGEASSLWGMLPKSSVKTLTPCVCVSVNLAKYRDTLQNDVVFLKQICKILSSRLNSGITLASSLSGSVESRLAAFILEHEQDNVFAFQLTTCADILNVSYRHLLRTMATFRNEKLIKKQKSYYIITNHHRLQEIAELFETSFS
ncbi:cyclic nucleotide-binding domain-containing protein [Ornithinibacillus sp. BX22]|uniref:Cyclic nucleotide-binding domain-containing protein n=1 Tax=Ornithinibacillus hominis TaxID=2763055 RepID=A0A923L8K2_9BACI|nr:cyclic nucleotide-binding domain-containing protein [Ornithinibacillus hominis]MBC5638458.1 cyclic nucleotide-binding domain-containing protein [Ornithinibacillus hominis]